MQTPILHTANDSYPAILPRLQMKMEQPELYKAVGRQLMVSIPEWMYIKVAKQIKEVASRFDGEFSEIIEIETDEFVISFDLVGRLIYSPFEGESGFVTGAAITGSYVMAYSEDNDYETSFLDHKMEGFLLGE